MRKYSKFPGKGGEYHSDTRCTKTVFVRRQIRNAPNLERMRGEVKTMGNEKAKG